MKFLPVMVAMLGALMVAGCSGGSGTSASQGAAAGAAATWPTNWCQAQPGISKEQLVSIMGQPTHAFPTQMSWSDQHYQFNAFLEQDGTVKQLDINMASLSDAEKAALKCGQVRTQRSMAAMAAQSSAPPLPRSVRPVKSSRKRRCPRFSVLPSSRSRPADPSASTSPAEVARAGPTWSSLLTVVMGRPEWPGLALPASMNRD
jgi:hypothetical protein